MCVSNIFSVTAQLLIYIIFVRYRIATPLCWSAREKAPFVRMYLPDTSSLYFCAFSVPGIGGIHLLGYPAGGKWEIRKLGKEVRLASQLRFKVVRDTQDRLRGMVFHLPCRFPDKLCAALGEEQEAWIKKNEQEIWENIHRQLNRSRRLKPLFD